MNNVYDVLAERGFVEQVSDEAGIRALLEEPITCYIGFDPTASSFHVGNLVPIMALAHMQRHGHRPIAVVGGGTGMIGDPSGRSELRKMMTPEQIQANLEAQRAQLAHFLDLDDGKALVLNNADWLTKWNYIDFLREIGRHFSVNRMLAAEAYRARFETGLNFIEFNYMLLQSYDFLHLYREYGCKLQMGGNDQWGNILAGVDLIRRVEEATAYALVFPLITTSSGAKMGKSAAGAVWLDSEQVSSYEYYQYWINTEDPDVGRFLAMFTFLPLKDIAALSKLEGAKIREAKEVLAFEATKILHGEEQAVKAREASRRLFAKGGAVGEGVPTAEASMDDLTVGIAVTELFNRVGLCPSRGAARRLIQQGGAYVNGTRIDSVDLVITDQDLDGGAILLRAGKKRYCRVVVS